MREILNTLIFQIYRRLAFQIDPEKVHDVTLSLLDLIYRSYLGKVFHKKLIQNGTKQFNILFDNPIGLAAGFDKNADYLNFTSNVGFGFIEVGTLTPKPQYGNPRPRIFRLIENEAIINHLGFNNLVISFAICIVTSSWKD